MNWPKKLKAKEIGTLCELMSMETDKTPIEEHRYGVGMLVNYKGKKGMKILEEYETTDELGIGYIFWFNEFERKKINVNLYMFKFNEDGLERILEDFMRELHDKLIMAKLIARHYNN